MQFYLKDAKGADAQPIDEKDAQNVLKRLRYQGRKLVEIYVLGEGGKIDRFQERTRRKLGSNAIASRTWLCETLNVSEWVDGRYVQDPPEAIGEMEPVPTAVVLILQGADAPEEVVPQLEEMAVAS